MQEFNEIVQYYHIRDLKTQKPQNGMTVQISMISSETTDIVMYF